MQDSSHYSFRCRSEAFTDHISCELRGASYFYPLFRLKFIIFAYNGINHVGRNGGFDAANSDSQPEHR